MSRLLTYLILGATFVGSQRPAVAQEVPNSISSANWTVTRESRRAQANDWLREISRIDEQIPTLSPSEQAWLKVEYDDEIARNNGSTTARANRARYGREGTSRSRSLLLARCAISFSTFRPH